MAESPAHTWGQTIGTTFEDGVKRALATVAVKHGLYLDHKGPRAARPGKKVVWTDLEGNAHDLDYVLERNGTEGQIGDPLAFIEVAWRRYTKHSRNKAQEIQGAVLPLAKKYRRYSPFLGAIIGGEFTDGALAQLRSVGFAVLHLPYSEVIDAFDIVGISASSEENTPQVEFRNKLSQWDRLSAADKQQVGDALLATSKLHVRTFIDNLINTLTRTISRIIVMPLAGISTEFQLPDAAAAFLSSLNVDASMEAPFVRVEMRIEYSNGDSLTVSYQSVSAAVQFLQNLV